MLDKNSKDQHTLPECRHILQNRASSRYRQFATGGLTGLESASLSETEWLRRDNEALHYENARLHQEIGRWKSRFHEWARVEIARKEERERIGF